MEIMLSSNQDPPALSCLVLFAQKGTKSDAKTNKSCREIMLNYHHTTGESSKLCFTHKLLVCSCKWRHKRMVWFKKTIELILQSKFLPKPAKHISHCSWGPMPLPACFPVDFKDNIQDTQHQQDCHPPVFDRALNSHTNRRVGLCTMAQTSMEVEFTVSHEFLT